MFNKTNIFARQYDCRRASLLTDCTQNAWQIDKRIRRFVYARCRYTLIDIWLDSRANNVSMDVHPIRGGSRDKTRVREWLLKRITYRAAIISGIDSGQNFHVSYAPRVLPTQERLKRVRPVLLVHYVTGHIHSGVCVPPISGLNHKSSGRYSYKTDRRVFICSYTNK